MAENILDIKWLFLAEKNLLLKMALAEKKFLTENGFGQKLLFILYFLKKYD